MRKKSISVNKIIDRFSLEIMAGENGLDKCVSVSDIKRPGIELAGFWKHFVPERVQMLGMTEMSFLKGLDDLVLQKRIEKFMSYNLRCIIISRSLELPRILKETAADNDIPLLRTSTSTTRFMSKLTSFLERELAPEKTIHGVLVDIYGIGVLIRGRSGIGKSETALELVKRGHRLVADDVIVIKKIGEDELIGLAPEKSRHFLEIRGIGIINVRTLFGAGAVKDSSFIDMTVALEMWNESKSYERLGLDNKVTKLMGIEMSEVVIPVKRGRNLAMVLEVAAMNTRMKSMGYNAARDFVDKTVENGNSGEE